MRRLLILIQLIAVLTVKGQTTPEKLNAITDRYKWMKAELSIRKARVKDSLSPEAPFLLSLYYFNDRHPTFHIDSANEYHRLAGRLFTGRERNRRSVPDSATLVRLRTRIDSAAFEKAKRDDTEDAYQYFISHYASAKEVPMAIELRDEQAFLKALKANASQSFRLFLERYPASHRAREAMNRMERLEFEEVTKDKRRASYERFYREFPRSPYRSLAEQKMFELITASGSPKSFLRFLKAYPGSRWATRARSLLFSLQRDGEEFADAPWKTDSLKRAERSSAYWVPVIKSGLYGFIDERGTEVISPRFKQIPEGYRCGEISERYVVTSQGLLARNGAMVWAGLVKDFDDLGLGFVFIATDSGGFVMHESGFHLTTAGTDDALVIANRFVAVNQNDQWAVLTLTGVRLLPQDFDDIAVLDSVVQLTKNHKKILTTPARMARASAGLEFKEDFVFDETRKWGDQHYWVRNGVLEGVVDANLKFLIPLDRQILRKTSFGFVAAKGDGVYVNGIKKLERKAYKLVAEQAGWVRMKDTAGRHWLFDRGFGWLISGDSVWFQGQLAFLQGQDSVSAHLPGGQRLSFLKGSFFQFKEYRDSSAWLVLEEKKKKVVYDAATGARLYAAEVDQIEPTSESLFLVTLAKKKGLVRADGKIVLPVEYDAIVPSGEHSFSLLKDKKFGWFDSRTKSLVKPVFDRNVRPYNDKLWLAFKENGYVFIHADGKPLGIDQWTDVQYWTDSIAWVKKGDSWRLLDVASQKIKLDNIKVFRYLSDSPTEKIALVQQEKVFGVISTRRGTIIPIQYTDIINLGTGEIPLYFTERHIAEAGISVIVYFNQYGKIIRKQAMEADEFEKIACDN